MFLGCNISLELGGLPNLFVWRRTSVDSSVASLLHLWHDENQDIENTN